MKWIFALFAVLLPATGYAQSNFEKAKQFSTERDYLQAYNFALPAVKEAPKNVEVLLLAGEIYLEMEKVDSAVQFLARAEDIDNSTNVIRKYAKALARAGKFQDAVKYAKKAIKKDEKDAYNQLALADVYLKADSLKQAEMTIIVAKELNKKIPDGFVALGDLYYAQKVYELARMNYEEALLLDSTLLDARIKLATSYYKLANAEPDKDLSNELFSRSLKEWNRITKEDPKNASAFYEQGKIFYLADKYGEAAKSFYQYTLLRPEGWLGMWYLAQSSFKIGQYDSAVKQLEIVKLKIDTVNERATLLLAQSQFELKKYKESAANFAIAQKFSVTNPAIKIDALDMERWGRAAILSGDTATAFQNFKTVIDNSDGKKCSLMYSYAYLLKEKKMYDESIQVYRKRIAACNDSMSIKSRLFIGLNYYSYNKPDSAVIALQEFIQLDPNNLYGRIMLSNSFAALKLTDSSKKTLLDAFEIGKQNPATSKRDLENVLGEICRIYLDAKDYTNLLKYAKTWSELNPESPTAFIYIAVSYQGNADKDNACKNYREVLKRDKENKVAKQNMKALGC
ncbi:MAG: tetratricopeptide repeat protein [Ignavibacteria bacterium]|nr:tetratricopeptide repeat protein [Ignavibacteria bacterium]